MVKRIVVGAHYGLRDWLMQRITAVVITAFAVILGVAICLQPTGDYESWKSLWSHGFIRFAALLAVISLLLHAWIGVRDIFMDYIKSTGLRLGLQVLVILALVLYGAWSVQILWSA
ncbi:MAG: succinate dehydrogenase, hydrophobic membrane anchor protein [Betaproteobacteria bacterium]|nr:succinate dehydrogenase, hydrophobic membrane anchor protein [Betaproteobacteria bacterium]